MNLVFMSLTAAAAEAKAKAAGDIEGKEMGNLTDPASQPVYMAPTPLFHVTANNCLLQPCTLVGGKIVLTYKWDPGRALELIEREGVTTFSGVPTMSRELISHPDWETRDTSTVQGMGGGGAAVQPDLVEKIDKSLSRGALSTGYGLTETHGIVTANAAKFFIEKPASCGRPYRSAMSSSSMTTETTSLSPQRRGGNCVRGPVVVKGYINRPDATAMPIGDGWFNTGDVAMVDDDGFLYIVDRAKDMVLRGGENVYSAEVEAAIYQNEAVAEARVWCSRRPPWRRGWCRYSLAPERLAVGRSPSRVLG